MEGVSPGRFFRLLVRLSTSDAGVPPSAGIRRQPLLAHAKRGGISGEVTMEPNGITIGERIVAYLEGLPVDELSTMDPWPVDATQDGIAAAVGISRAHVAPELKRLKVRIARYRRRGVPLGLLAFALLAFSAVYAMTQLPGAVNQELPPGVVPATGFWGSQPFGVHMGLGSATWGAG